MKVLGVYLYLTCIVNTYLDILKTFNSNHFLSYNIHRFQIKELELGDQFPDVRSLSVHNVELDKDEQRIENLDLLLDINYVGNFTTSIDADMVLGKKGSITLKGE